MFLFNLFIRSQEANTGSLESDIREFFKDFTTKQKKMLNCGHVIYQRLALFLEGT